MSSQMWWTKILNPFLELFNNYYFSGLSLCVNFACRIKSLPFHISSVMCAPIVSYRFSSLQKPAQVWKTLVCCHVYCLEDFRATFLSIFFPCLSASLNYSSLRYSPHADSLKWHKKALFGFSIATSNFSFWNGTKGLKDGISVLH